MTHRRPTFLARLAVLIAITTSLSCAESIAAKSPGLPEFNVGVTLFEAHQPRKAIKHLTQSIVLDPFNSSAYVLRGRAHLELEERAEALKDANKALSLDKNSADAYELRARVKCEKADYKGAYGDITRALELEPARRSHLVERFKLRAKISTYLGEDKKAVEDFSKAIATDKKVSIGCYYHRANIYMRWGKYHDAISDYTNALNLPKRVDSERVYAQRAKAYEAIGRKDLAEKDRATLRELSKQWGFLD